MAILLMALGCDTPERISRLEKQTQDLKGELDKIHASSDIELQSKCSHDAKEFLNEHWDREKDTTLLDETNHYNKKLNKCFVLVEYHYTLGTTGSWSNSISLWNVYENSQHGTFQETHMIYGPPNYGTNDHVYGCEIDQKKCTTIEQFNTMLGEDMLN